MTDGRFSNQLPNWINLKEANIYKLLDDSWRKEKKKLFFMFRLTAHESRIRVCAVYCLKMFALSFTLSSSVVLCFVLYKTDTCT